MLPCKIITSSRLCVQCVAASVVSVLAFLSLFLARLFRSRFGQSIKHGAYERATLPKLPRRIADRCKVSEETDHELQLNCLQYRLCCNSVRCDLAERFV